MTRKHLPVVAALLLVLIGWAVLWWMNSTVEPDAAPGGNTNSVDMSAPTAPAPDRPETMTAPMAPAPAPPESAGAPPPDRFIVCPGNPRCPPRQSTH